MCVRVYVSTCSYLQVLMRVWVRRPEIGIECLCLLLDTSIFEGGSLTEPGELEFTDLA